MQHLLPVRVAGIWPNQRLLRRAARCQGVFILALPGPGALAGLIAITGNDRDIVVQADQHASREWEQAGGTWWLPPVRPDQTAEDVTALIDVGPG